MHFSKTYAEILEKLPPELRENGIQYRQLKKLINQVVLELSAHGLSPPLLRNLIFASDVDVDDAQAEVIITNLSKVVYEIGDPDHIHPRLRLLIDPSDARLRDLLPVVADTDDGQVQASELVIPLAADEAFFTLLSTALEALKQHLIGVHTDFIVTLKELTSAITCSARPMSATTTFRPHSFISSDATASLRPSSTPHNDLYIWREIFQLYMEIQVFESTAETTRGENSVEESERRLQLFVSQLTQRNLNDRKKFKSKHGREALDTFMRLNFCILDIKKLANNEAARKILKKHTKRTSLPLPQPQDYTTILPVSLSSSNPTGTPLLPHVFIQAISETLIPIIPHIDDYACLICTGIAFKPIRLACGHLFCVRCLVKMQKRGNSSCPMCRMDCVLAADKSNVDWAMLNFMQDWFPKETRAKIKQNENEVLDEQLAELKLDSNIGCTVM
ncbi:hypothetical protein ONZ45_g9389 [Pleurotus djamor]|nr:hypothetical protein ONZ45_g9389 [Pleurotus djamor]